MANYDVAYSWLMYDEDRKQLHAAVPDPVTAHADATPKERSAAQTAHAISGINSYFYPEQYNAIASLPQNQRDPGVKAFYKQYFWTSGYAQSNPDDLIKRVFDCAVNTGPGMAVQLLQKSINQATGIALKVDGGFGPDTIHAVNFSNADALLSAFRQLWADHYRSIVKANPSRLADLNGWLARAAR